MFIDESGFLMAPLVRRSWAPRGRTPTLTQRTRSHQKVSAIAALVVSPQYRCVRLFFRLHSQTAITAILIRDFLRQLKRHISGRCIILWDRLNTHRAGLVLDFLGSSPRLSVEYFPPYAPELNPVEYVWGYLKTSPLANYPIAELETLANITRRHSRALQTRPKLLKSFLRHSSLF